MFFCGCASNQNVVDVNVTSQVRVAFGPYSFGRIALHSLIIRTNLKSPNGVLIAVSERPRVDWYKVVSLTRSIVEQTLVPWRVAEKS